MDDSFEKAWDVVKEEVVCDFCSKSVPSQYIARSSTDYPPVKPRWEGCYECLEAGKIIDNDGKEVR